MKKMRSVCNGKDGRLATTFLGRRFGCV